MISIESYFSELSKSQAQQFEKLPSLYRFWNEQINVISRKDMENFNERHVLHSLGIAKVISFKKDTQVLDVGTGGGFPGIPLAILFPEVHFTLVDSIGKKIKVVKEISNELGLQNISAHKSPAAMKNRLAQRRAFAIREIEFGARRGVAVHLVDDMIQRRHGFVPQRILELADFAVDEYAVV